MNLFNNSPQTIPSNLPQEAWQKAPFNISEEMRRRGHASVLIDQYLVIIGGWNPSSVLMNANLVVVDLHEETCTPVEISGREPNPLFNHSACYWKDNQIIVYGGQGLHNEILSEAGIITLSFTGRIKAEWKTIQTDSKIRRKGHTAHVYNNNQMIVIGGYGPNENPQTGIHILHLGEEFKWTQPKMAGKPPKGGLAFHTSVFWGNEIYVLGKRDSENSESSHVFSSLNLERYVWKKIPRETQGFECEFAALQEHKGKIYLVEKVIGQTRLITKSFDITQSKWSSDLQSKDKDSLTKTDFSLNVYDNQLVLYGGEQIVESGSLDPLWFFKLGDSEIQKNTIKRRTKDTMTENLKAFFTEAPYSDVTFEVESELICAHKWWLCKKSKYFANMSSSGMIEAKSSKIIVTDMSAKTFRAFLEYLYSNDIELDVDMAQDLLTQADKYSVPELKGLCEQFLIGNISADNYVALANLSELLEANKLRDAVRDYIAKNIKVLKERKDFEEISMDMLRDVVVKVTAR